MEDNYIRCVQNCYTYILRVWSMCADHNIIIYIILGGHLMNKALLAVVFHSQVLSFFVCQIHIYTNHSLCETCINCQIFLLIAKLGKCSHWVVSTESRRCMPRGCKQSITNTSPLPRMSKPIIGAISVVGLVTISFFRCSIQQGINFSYCSWGGWCFHATNW